MASTSEFAFALRSIPELRVLATCAARCRIRFWLKHPVADLYLRLAEWHGREHVSLYDFIGPFENITLLFEDEAHPALLDDAIANSLPLAGFHGWSAGRFPVSFPNPFVAADSLTVGFDGRDGAEAIWEVADISPEAAADSHDHPEWLLPLYYPDLLIMALRTARYWFGHARSPERPLAPHSFEAMGRWLQSIRGSNVASQLVTPWFLSAIDSAVLSLLFSAVSFSDALAWLRDMKGSFVYGSAVLKEVLSESRIVDAELIGAVQQSRPARSRLFFDLPLEPATGQSPESAIPWTSIGPDGFEDGYGRHACCEDIPNPPTTICWRRREGPAFLNATPSALAVAMRSRIRRGEAVEDRLRAVPGIVFRDVSLTARLLEEYEAADGVPAEYGIVAEVEEP